MTVTVAPAWVIPCMAPDVDWAWLVVATMPKALKIAAEINDRRKGMGLRASPAVLFVTLIYSPVNAAHTSIAGTGLPRFESSCLDAWPELPPMASGTADAVNSYWTESEGNSSETDGRSL